MTRTLWILVSMVSALSAGTSLVLLHMGVPPWPWTMIFLFSLGMIPIGMQIAYRPEVRRSEHIERLAQVCRAREVPLRHGRRCRR